MKKQFCYLLALGFLCLTLSACDGQDVPETQLPSGTQQGWIGETLFPVPETSREPFETATLPSLEMPEKPGEDYQLPPGENGIETVADK